MTNNLPKRKSTSNLIHNELLGYTTKQEIEYCVKHKIITYRQGCYCIPMVLTFFPSQRDGRQIRSSSKEWVVSPKYLEYIIKRRSNVKN